MKQGKLRFFLQKRPIQYGAFAIFIVFMVLWTREWNCLGGKSVKFPMQTVVCHSKSYMLKYIPEYLAGCSDECNAFRHTYTIENPHICSAKDVLLLIGVRSVPKESEQRNLIRKTWGSYKTIFGSELRVLFLMGQDKDEKLQHELVKENKQTQDILQADFVDSYHNLSLKTVMAYKWVSERCERLLYFAMVDADIFVDTFKLIRYLQQPAVYTEQAYVLCKAECGAPAREDVRGHANVTKEQWMSDIYPPWCWGGAFVLAAPIVKRLYKVSQHTARFPIDDVWGGVLAVLDGNICFPESDEAFVSPWHPNDELMNSTTYFHHPVIFAGIHETKEIVENKIKFWWQRTADYHLNLNA